MQFVGKIIRNRRESIGILQAEAAERAGVDKQTWSRWETDKNTPTQRSLKKIAEALETTVEGLYKDEPIQIQEPGDGLIQGLGPDTVQTLTRDMTKWRMAWSEGGITEAQLQKAVDLILKRMEALTSGDNGGSKSEEITGGSETEKRATS